MLIAIIIANVAAFLAGETPVSYLNLFVAAGVAGYALGEDLSDKVLG